ncbi:MULTISPECIES: H-NS histone family protein [unclassified Burkholderia]|uniref:H-NS histone family protein n=1 Tax=unclassified Burkholderia TaxID=2613784 RepID=UPI00141F4168|nr:MULTISPECIES: H-NS histone family protein [unclassified Burkholderia]NIE81843.1 H-NS histone family protein [Burkholderia sp. Tr-860]NIF61193.1 H-NS histone family protein [Burkholderia sp. Cy-647]NIF93934.1 H-NS histone family protein [Burkholderia sp. Ax-1720]
MSTYKELLEQRAALETEIQAAQAEERAQALNEVKRIVSEFALTKREIFGISKTRKRQPVPPRYRDPESGATWSGRGRPPAWIDGKDRSQFQIVAPAVHA